ncbi:MAG: alpha-ribazole phosphatase [Phototrophicaceae bacterium]
MTTTLWLIRHGETDWNVEQRFQGSSDKPLNAHGKAQATSLVPRLAEMSFDTIYASDLIRVQQTAHFALGGNTDTLISDARLRELHFGTWEGLTWKEANDKFGAEFALWADNRDLSPHGGETISDVVVRVESFLETIRSKHQDDDNILIFAHGGVLAVLVCLLLDTNPTQWWKFRFLNCTINEVVLANRGAILARLNDARHLDDL